MKDTLKFCKRRHDLSILGLNKQGGCRMCSRIRDKLRYCGKRRDAYKAYSKNYYKQNKEKFRGNNWKAVGIINPDGSPFTTVDYDRLYQIQQGCCAICKKHSSECSKALHADHNHNTGVIRSLLCNECNIRLGVYEANHDKCAEYLKLYGGTLQ